MLQKPKMGIGINLRLGLKQLDELIANGWVVILAISLDVPHFVVYLEPSIDTYRWWIAYMLKEN